jgi:hypothetical protein
MIGNPDLANTPAPPEWFPNDQGFAPALQGLRGTVQIC